MGRRLAGNPAQERVATRGPAASAPLARREPQARMVAPIDEEALMALARVVTFEGVGKDRVEEMKREMREGQQPEGMPATEIVVLTTPRPRSPS